MAADAPYIIVSGASPFPFPLTREEMTVGRSADRDIHLDDSEVSRTHATFTRRGTATFLTDLGSSNGTYVNGSRLQGTIELHDGDQITFATVEATFHAAPGSIATAQSSPAAAGASPPLPPGPVSPGPSSITQSPLQPPGPDLGAALPGSPGPSPQSPAGPGFHPPGSNPAGTIPPGPGTSSPLPTPGPRPPTQTPVGPLPSGGTTRHSQPPVPQAALEHAGGAPVLLTQAELRIGRIPGNDVVLQDSHVSSHHAVIQNQGSQFFLIDLGSSNGTYVNGQRVVQPYLLEPGDEIRIGQSEFFFRRLAPVPKRRGKGGPPGPPGPRPGRPPSRT
jgi:ABC transport system ATP-binding/permease protein